MHTFRRSERAESGAKEVHAMFNTAKAAALLAGMAGLFMVLGAGLGGRGGATIGLVMGLATVGWSYWKSDTLAIKAAGAREVSAAEQPWLHSTVNELCQRADLPMPRLYISPNQQPNAFATGRNPENAAVAVTEGLLRTCSQEEVRGVLAHELGHVNNRDILIGSVAAAIATAIGYVAMIARFGAMFGGRRDDDSNPLVLIATAMLAPLAAGVLQMALSRTREYQADRWAAELLGTGRPLAQALARLEAGAQRIPSDVPPAQASAYIVNPLAGTRMNFKQLFSTHPPMQERIMRLETFDRERGMR